MNASAENSRRKASLVSSQRGTLPQQGHSPKRTTADDENFTSLPLTHDIARDQGTMVMPINTTREKYTSNLTSVGGQRNINSTNAAACLFPVPLPSSIGRSSQPWDFPRLLDFPSVEAFDAAISEHAIFGRDPACTAAYSSFKATQPMTLYTEACFTSSWIDDTSYTFGLSLNVQTLSAGAQGICCVSQPLGSARNTCTVTARDLQLMYWPAPIPNTSCLGKVTSNPSNYTGHWNLATISPQTVASNLTVFATDSDGYI